MKKEILICATLFNLYMSAYSQTNDQKVKDQYDMTASVTDYFSSDNKGSINLTVTGGVAPYSFEWSNGAKTEDVSGLDAGDYVVTVTDKSGRKICFLYTVQNTCTAAPALKTDSQLYRQIPFKNNLYTVK